MRTYDALVDAHTQCLQGVDEALLVRHGLVAEAADVVLVQSQHGQAFADASSQLHTKDSHISVASTNLQRLPADSNSVRKPSA